MLPAIKAEFLKLISVRSTYVILGIAVVLVLLNAGFAEGFKASKEALMNPRLLESEITTALNALGIFAGIAGILLFSHEYQYNTITYTLTSSNSRTKVLLAKILVITGFALLFALVMGVLSPLATLVGVKLAGGDMVAQSIGYADVAWRGAFFVWGYAMAGLLLVALTRSQVFSIIALFFIPIVESIASALIKKEGAFLPFSSLGSVINKNPDMSPEKGAVVFAVYLLSTWVTAWYLFLRRDAS